MCAGLRDVWDLARKLDLVMKGQADPALLQTYTAERAPHVTDVIKISMFLGSIICMPDPEAAAKRDAMFLGGDAPKPAPFPILTDGLLQRDTAGVVLAPAGELSPHGAVRSEGKTGRFDAVVPPGFILMVAADLAVDAGVKQSCAALGLRLVVVADRRFAGDVQIGETQGQFGRFTAQHGIQAMLIRPDFYLFGGAKDPDGLTALLADFARQRAALNFNAKQSVAVPA